MRAGIDIGRAYNEGVERKRLEGIRTAAPEMSQGYTAEQGQQLEAMASAINPETGRPYYNVQAGQGGNYTVTPDFTEAQIPRTGMGTDVVGIDRTQLQPAAFNQQRVTDFLGRRFEGELTPDRIEALRSRAMAEGLSDPRQRQAALAEATRAEREAEEAPLRRQALETQVEAGKLGLTRTQQEIERGGIELTAAQRAAEAAKREDNLNLFISQNPNAGFAEISTEAKRLGMSSEQQFKVASNLTGIGEQQFKASQQRIRKLTENQGLDGLLKAHKESNDLDPNSHFEVIRGKGGRVSLNRVNTATGEVIQPNVFSGNEAETTAYLNRAAMDPATIIDFTMNLEKNRAAIEASRSTTNLANVRAAGLTRDADTLAKLDRIDQQLEAIPPGEMSGPVARGLLMQRNAIIAGTSKQVSIGASPRPEVTAAAVAEYAKGLVGKPSGVMKDGKPVRYTAETAAVAARRALSAQDGAAADPADALIEAMRRNAPAQQQATSAGQSLVNLSNTMLPPAAPVQTAPTTRQEQLRGLYLGQPRQQ
jgi:hypothetical protein